MDRTQKEFSGSSRSSTSSEAGGSKKGKEKQSEPDIIDQYLKKQKELKKKTTPQAKGRKSLPVPSKSPKNRHGTPGTPRKRRYRPGTRALMEIREGLIQQLKFPNPDIFQKVPKVYQSTYTKTALFQAYQGIGCSDLFCSHEVSVCRHDGPAGGCRGLPGDAVRGHRLVRHPCQACNSDAQGHESGQANPRGACCLVDRTIKPSKWKLLTNLGHIYVMLFI
eukprot:GFUD01067954.1.p1 GENE.GFUD01067954.1~~GFUD01067954.1.p1  ORF type:complete len:221 (+),score=29.55 GFUD01067954.1:79-741(+)